MATDNERPLRVKSGSLFVVGIISLFAAILLLLAAIVYYAWKKEHARRHNPAKPPLQQRL